MQRKKHSPELKAMVAIEAIQELKMLNQIASENGINPNLLSRWKTEAITNLPKVFSTDNTEVEKLKRSYEEKIEELYKQIGKHGLSTVSWTN